MITVERKLLSNEEVLERLGTLARRYRIEKPRYEDYEADQMSDFDAQKWISLCDHLRAARRRQSELLAGSCVPLSLTSIYGGQKSPFRPEDPDSNCDKLIELAA
ncbi:MAG TPA: hypothetical protein VND90_09600 [Terracidiphilus sp.]|nr:hypothetical protein [Terracidiphilus sp.]